jgi:hypothetical protein
MSKDKNKEKDKVKSLKKSIEKLEERIEMLDERVSYLESELDYEQTDRGIEEIATQEAVARILHLVAADGTARDKMADRLGELDQDAHDYEADREAIYEEYFGDDNEVVMDEDALAEMEERIYAIDHAEALDEIEFYLLDGAVNGVPADDDEPVDADVVDEERAHPSEDAEAPAPASEPSASPKDSAEDSSSESSNGAAHVIDDVVKIEIVEEDSDD